LKNIIDAHIHLDQYKDEDIEKIIMDSSFIEAIISVSMDLDSAKHNLLLATKYPQVKPAFGFHPEQALPSERYLEELIHWIEVNKDNMIAVGEVGLPYYTRQEKVLPLEQYIDLLETFVKLAKRLDKPIVLHAVYDDAPIVCDLLEKYSIKKAHFHWFKGDLMTIERLIQNEYFISFTPDIVYETEIQELAKGYPLKQIMVETDGPWPFEGPFKGRMTHPRMIHESIFTISKLKNLPLQSVYNQLLQNTKLFYSI